MSNYNAEIHARAKKIIEERRARQDYETDCFLAGICSKCGNELICRTTEPNSKGGESDVEYVCVDCGSVRGWI